MRASPNASYLVRQNPDHSTSLKVFRKVYKDHLVSYETNRYPLPHTVDG